MLTALAINSLIAWQLLIGTNISNHVLDWLICLKYTFPLYNPRVKNNDLLCWSNMKRTLTKTSISFLLWIPMKINTDDNYALSVPKILLPTLTM